MTKEQSPVLEFPAWLHGTTAAILRQAGAEGKWWVREYLETGAFPQPRQMRQVAPGMENLWRKTLEAWCPGGPASVREHLALTVERMARTTREESLEAVLRVLVKGVKGGKGLVPTPRALRVV